MKCQYKAGPTLIIELDAPNIKELFEKMAEASEIFGYFDCCGNCKDTAFRPRPVVRLNKKKQKFYELHCTNPKCKARFAFGQNQDTPTLFPQRKVPKSEEFKPNDGWVVWRPEQDE